MLKLKLSSVSLRIPRCNFVNMTLEERIEGLSMGFYPLPPHPPHHTNSPGIDQLILRRHDHRKHARASNYTGKCSRLIAATPI